MKYFGFLFAFVVGGIIGRNFEGDTVYVRAEFIAEAQERCAANGDFVNLEAHRGRRNRLTAAYAHCRDGAVFRIDQ